METSEIFELLDKFDKSSLSEVIISRGDLRVTLRKTLASAEYQLPVHPAPGVTGVTHPTSQQVTAAGAGSGSEEAGEVIASPIVGTFYRAPSPDSPPFAEAGQQVKKGDTICVIEAMKVMNELQAEFDCEIVDVLVENGTMIEFGTPLFSVKR